MRDVRFDYLLAAGVALALETELIVAARQHGLSVLQVIAVGLMALSVLWRRRSPLVFIAVVCAGLIVSHLPIGGDHATWFGLFGVLLPTYSAAAWEKRGRALMGLAVWTASVVVAGTLQHAHIATLAPGVLTATAAWGAGRAVRAQRALATELRRRSSQLAAERNDHVRLAIDNERMRIARELHAVVATNVAAMVIVAEAGERLLDGDAGTADAALCRVEDTGRATLVEMRRIVGVLRRPDEGVDLKPQPGVGQIHFLIQRAREEGRPVDMRITGEPRNLQAIVDLSLYRIVEEALNGARPKRCSAITVDLNFDLPDLELRMSAQGTDPDFWPTSALRERVALCRGDLRAEANGQSCELVVHLPGQRKRAPV